MFKNILYNFIKSFDCDPKLLDIIYKCKDNLEKTGQYVEPVRIETSIKTLKNGTEIKKRYGISIPINEFQKYTVEDSTELVEFLGFKLKDINLINNCIRIYFALEGNKGKIYVGNTRELVCKEQGNKIKYYITRKDKPDWMDIFTNSESGKRVAINIRIYEKDKVNWYTVSKDFRTKYFRPYIHFEKDIINTLDDSHKNIYQFYKLWYYQYCICNKCFSKDFEKDTDYYKYNQELLKEAEDDLLNSDNIMNLQDSTKY